MRQSKSHKGFARITNLEDVACTQCAGSDPPCGEGTFIAIDFIVPVQYSNLVVAMLEGKYRRPGVSGTDGYRVRMVVLEGGERLPLLVGWDGVPLFRPMVWLLTMRRATNAASATLRGNLLALKLLYSWADWRGIDLESRMLAGEYLSSSESSSLIDATKRALAIVAAEELMIGGAPRRRSDLEVVRLRPKKWRHEVDTATASIRVGTIIAYLGWLTNEGLNCFGGFHGQRREMVEAQIKIRDGMLKGLRARAPRTSRRNVLGDREAPPQQVIDTLLEIVELNAVRNPWCDLGLQVRNRLLIHMFYGLGIRKGEALGIKIDNIDFYKNELLITRSADDPIDTRRYQPLTKTRDRRLPMKDKLVAMLHDYVVHVRAKLPKAKRHPFLFVSHRDGAPLALVSANKIFNTLRERCDGLPNDLTPHLLRHAWNDSFSRLCEEQQVKQAREEQMRSELMGWSPTSGTSAIYTKRFARQSAEKLSVTHQKNMLGVKNGN